MPTQDKSPAGHKVKPEVCKTADAQESELLSSITIHTDTIYYDVPRLKQKKFFLKIILR